MAEHVCCQDTTNESSTTARSFHHVSLHDGILCVFVDTVIQLVKQDQDVAYHCILLYKKVTSDPRIFQKIRKFHPLLGMFLALTCR